MKKQKLTKQQKAEIKRKALKGLNIACYIVSALSLFIFGLTAIKGCAAKDKKATVTTTPVVQQVERVNNKKARADVTRSVNEIDVKAYEYITEYNTYFGGYTYVLSPYYLITDGGDIHNSLPVGSILFEASLDTPICSLTLPTTSDGVQRTIPYVQRIQIQSWIQIYNSESWFEDYYMPNIQIAYKSSSSSTSLSWTSFALANYLEDLTGIYKPSFTNFYMSFYQVSGETLYKDDSWLKSYNSYNFEALSDIFNHIGLVRRTSKWNGSDNWASMSNHIRTVSMRSNYYFDYTFTVGNYLYSRGIDNYYNSFDEDDTRVKTGYCYQTLFYGSFVCNGVSYNSIVLEMAQSYPTWGLTGDSWENVYIVPSRLYYCNGLNIANGVVVAQNNTLLTALSNMGLNEEYLSTHIFEAEGDGGLIHKAIENYYIPNASAYSFAWVNSIYRTILINYYYNNSLNGTLITMANDSFIDTIGYLTTSETASDNTSDTAGALGGIFGLLGGVFSSLSNFFSVEVLPNLTLGVFVFIPLVISIVLFIVWLFKR